MPDGQAPPPGGSWRSRPSRERPSPVGGSAGPGPWRCSALGRHPKLLETERSSSVQSFHWKEEQLLRRQLGLLDAMKKHEASVRLTEQKAFYRRCHAQLQRVELAHARLRGDRGLVRQLSGQNRWSRPPGPGDESGAAVRALLQGRLGLGSEGAGGSGSRPCSLEAIPHRPPLGPGAGRPGEDGARAASTRGAVQAQEPWWVLAVDAQSRPEPAAPQGEPPGQRDLPGADATAGPRQPEGKLLLYVMRGDLGEEQPQKKRPRPPRDKPRSPPGPRRGAPRE